MLPRFTRVCPEPQSVASRVPGRGVSGATHEIDLACVSEVHVYVCPSVQYSGTLKV